MQGRPMKTTSTHTISGIHQHKLRCLTPVLKKWIILNKNIAEAWANNDVPWWYGERACLSVFAGAIWKVGGIAFEEYSFEKRNKVHGKRIVNGRNDLYFELNGEEYIVEAKYSSFGASRLKIGAPGNIQDCLEKARRDIRKCPHSTGQRRLGIAFVRPYFTMHQKHAVSKKIKKWVENLQKLDYSCAAWVFPKGSRCFKGNYYAPGIAVLIKEVRRA